MWKKSLYSILSFVFALLGFFSFTGQSFAWSGETTNLELYLQFNNSLQDSSSYARDLQLATWSTPTYVASTWSYNTALQCNNSTVVVSTPWKYLPYVGASTWFTITYWKKWNAVDLFWLGYPIITWTGDTDPIVFPTSQILYISATGNNYQWQSVFNASPNNWTYYAFIVSYTGNITYYFMNWTYIGSWSQTPLYYWDRVAICGHRIGSTSSEFDFLAGTWTIDEFRYYSRVLSTSEVLAIYTWWELSVPPTNTDWLCGYALWFTGSFSTGDSCLAGTLTWLSTFDINWYTWYTYTCAGLWSGTNDSCYTAEQTTGACWTMQSQTFYEDIENYSNQYTYCSGGNDLMTWLQYIEGNYWDWYCNWPTEFWPQAYCSAYPFNQDVPSCWPSNLQTYTGDTTLTGSNLCAIWQDGWLLFRPNYGRIWGCYVENSMSSDISCVAYLSWGSWILTWDYILENPFDPLLYWDESQLSADSLYYLSLLRSKYEFFDTLRGFFTTYFVFFPQTTTTLTIYLPWISGNWMWTFWIDAWNAADQFYTSRECDSDMCTYVMPLGNVVEIPNNNFIKFLRVFLPVFLALIYVWVVILFILMVLFFPVYLLSPILSRLKATVFQWLDSASSNIVSFLTWFAYALPFYWLLFVLFAYYWSTVAPFFDEFKATLWYTLIFFLKLLMIDNILMWQAVIAINFWFWTIVVWYLFYRSTRYSAKL